MPSAASHTNPPGVRTGSRSLRYLAGAIVVLAFSVAIVPAPRAARETTPAAGSAPYFLVAIPGLPDPVFQQSVVLMLPPSGNLLVGGVIINKVTTIPSTKLLPGIATLKNPPGAYFGGPVGLTEPMLFMRSSAPVRGMTRLFDDVYITADSETIVRFLKTGTPDAKDMRLFFGRAQWSTDQLHGEVQEGAWYTAPAEAELLFNTDPSRVWRILIERAQFHEVDVTGKPRACADRLGTDGFALFPVSRTGRWLD
ncbi:MAG TPA: YqgE/AlgH family protein [Candidatus Binataceae bacterium]|nr:YqgE/AlgH family protein [Candidatus Binataceae bacterium]